MSLRVVCSCGKKLQAPDELAGKRAKCPSCGERVQIPALESLLEEIQADDLMQGLPPPSEPSPAFLAATNAPSIGGVAKTKKRTTRQSMSRVSKGMYLVFWGNLCALSFVFATILSALLGGVISSAVLGFLLLATMFLALFGIPLAICGRILCLAVPAKAGAKGWIIAAVACDLLWLGIQAAIFLGEVPKYMNGVSSLCTICAAIAFILFIRTVGEFARKGELVGSAQEVLQKIGVGVACIVGGLVAAVVPLLGLIAGPLLLLAGLIILILAFFKYLLLLLNAGILLS